MKRAFLTMVGWLFVSSPGSALTEERIDFLYNTIAQAMTCEVFASMSDLRNSEEHFRLRQVWYQAGSELGIAMLRGEIGSDDPGYGRRCLVSFEIPQLVDISEYEAGLRIGFELGEARSCLLDNLFLNGPLRNGMQAAEGFRESMANLGERSRQLFDERNCRFVDFEAE